MCEIVGRESVCAGRGGEQCFEKRFFTAFHVTIDTKDFHIAHRLHGLAHSLRQHHPSHLHALLPRLCFSTSRVRGAVRDYSTSPTIHLAGHLIFAAGPKHVEGELDEGGGGGQQEGTGGEGGEYEHR